MSQSPRSSTASSPPPLPEEETTAADVVAATRQSQSQSPTAAPLAPSARVDGRRHSASPPPSAAAAAVGHRFPSHDHLGATGPLAEDFAALAAAAANSEAAVRSSSSAPAPAAIALRPASPDRRDATAPHSEPLPPAAPKAAPAQLLAATATTTTSASSSLDNIGELLAARRPPSAASRAACAPCHDRSQTLHILHELNQIFADRLQQLEQSAGDWSEARALRIYREWVDSLSAQNRDLIRTVEQIEAEAVYRLRQLEQKLAAGRSGSGSSGAFAMAAAGDPHEVAMLRSDLQNLGEYVRRARDENRWSATGLSFYVVPPEVLVGGSAAPAEDGVDGGEEATKRGERVRTVGDIDAERLQANRDLEREGSSYLFLMDGLREELNQRDEQVKDLAREKSNLQKKCDRLQEELAKHKQATIDARALVMEVAEKHDTICKFRNEQHRLEDQLKQKDLHIFFKDKIIRDLRHEIKKTSQQQSINHNEGGDQRAHEMNGGSGAGGGGNRRSEQPRPDAQQSGDESYADTSIMPLNFHNYTAPNKSRNTLHTLNQEWAELQQQLDHKDRTIRERDEEIARQQRGLEELHGMRELVVSFRAALERLQGFEHFQQQQQQQQQQQLQPSAVSDLLHSANDGKSLLLHSSSSLSGGADPGSSSGFYSADSAVGSLLDANSNSRTLTPDELAADLATAAGSGGGTSLVAGIQRLLQDMCGQIASLTEENVQLTETLNGMGTMAVDEIRRMNGAGGGGGGGAAADATSATRELREFFGDFIKDVANVMQLRPPGDLDLTISATRHTSAAARPRSRPLDTLLRDMSSSIAGKERLLHERTAETHALRDQLQRHQLAASGDSRLQAEQIRGLERELFESKKALAKADSAASAERLELGRRLRELQAELAEARRQLALSADLDTRIGERDAQLAEQREQRRRLEEEVREVRERAERSGRAEREQNGQTIEDLKIAVSFHVATIDKLQTDKSAQDTEIQNLQHLIASHHEADQALVEKQFRLEIECKHQLITISNLRTALEAGSKQRSTSASSNSTGCGSSSVATAGSAPIAASASASSSSHSPPKESCYQIANALSDQLSAFFEENIVHSRHIDRLHDENLQLRLQLAECLQDYAQLEDGNWPRHSSRCRAERTGSRSRSRSRSSSCCSHSRGASRDGQSAPNSIIETNSQMDSWTSSTPSMSLALTAANSDSDNCRQQLVAVATSTPVTGAGSDQQQQQLDADLMKRPESVRMMEEMSAKVRDLFGQLQESQQHLRASDSLLANLRQLELRNDELQHFTATQAAQLTTLTAQHSAQLADLRHQLADLRHQLADAQLRFATQHRELSSLRSLSTEQRSQLTAHSQCSHQAAQHAAQVRRLQSHINQLATEHLSPAEAQSLRHENHRLASELHDLHAAHAAACAARDSLATEVQRLQADSLRRSDDSLRSAACAQREQELTAELNASTESRCQLGAESARLRGELDELRHRYESMHSTYALLHARLVRDWDALRQRAEQRWQQMRADAQRIEELQATNAGLGDRVRRLEEVELAGQREECARLRERLAFVQGGDTERERMGQRRVEGEEAAREELGRVRGREEMARKEAAAAKAEAAEEGRRAAEMAEGMAQLRAEYERLQEDYRDLKSVKEEAITALGAAKALRQEQRDRDTATAAKLHEQNQSIEGLLAERKRLVSRMRDMHRDAAILCGRESDGAQPQYYQQSLSPPLRTTTRILYRNDRSWSRSQQQSQQQQQQQQRSSAERLHRSDPGLSDEPGEFSADLQEDAGSSDNNGPRSLRAMQQLVRQMQSARTQFDAGLAEQRNRQQLVNSRQRPERQSDWKDQQP